MYTWRMSRSSRHNFSLYTSRWDNIIFFLGGDSFNIRKITIFIFIRMWIGFFYIFLNMFFFIFFIFRGVLFLGVLYIDFINCFFSFADKDFFIFSRLLFSILVFFLFCIEFGFICLTTPTPPFFGKSVIHRGNTLFFFLEWWRRF